MTGKDPTEEALALLREAVTLLRGVDDSLGKLRLASRGQQVGPFLNSGNTFSVNGGVPKLGQRVYKARSFPVVLIIQAQSTGNAGDALWFTTQAGSYASSYRIDIGGEAQERQIRVAAMQDLYAFASVAGGGTAVVTIIETAG